MVFVLRPFTLHLARLVAFHFTPHYTLTLKGCQVCGLENDVLSHIEIPVFAGRVIVDVEDFAPQLVQIRDFEATARSHPPIGFPDSSIVVFGRFVRHLLDRASVGFCHTQLYH